MYTGEVCVERRDDCDDSSNETACIAQQALAMEGYGRVMWLTGHDLMPGDKILSWHLRKWGAGRGQEGPPGPQRFPKSGN